VSADPRVSLRIFIPTRTAVVSACIFLFPASNCFTCYYVPMLSSRRTYFDLRDVGSSETSAADRCLSFSFVLCCHLHLFSSIRGLGPAYLADTL